MTRISPERKAEVIKSITEVGVLKTHDATGISFQTLYKGRSVMKADAPAEKSGIVKTKKRGSEDCVACRC